MLSVSLSFQRCQAKRVNFTAALQCNMQLSTTDDAYHRAALFFYFVSRLGSCMWCAGFNSVLRKSFLGIAITSLRKT
jgi:hypothetical protein